MPSFANVRERGEPMDCLELINKVVFDSVSKVTGRFHPAHEQRISFLQLPDRTTARVAPTFFTEGFEATPESLLAHRLADVDDGRAGHPSTIEVVERVRAEARTPDRVVLEERVGAFVVAAQHDVDAVPDGHAARIQPDERDEPLKPELF